MGDLELIVQRSTHSGLKKSIHAAAIFEAVKGVLVLVVGFGLLELLHKDAHMIACEFISHVHLNPLQKYPSIFIDLANHVTERKLWIIASLALIYSAFRFIEGYGLWKERAWAEWLAVISGMIYFPFEIYEILLKISFVRVFALVTNIVVVGIVIFALIVERKDFLGWMSSIIFKVV